MPLFHVLNHHAASPAMAARNNRPDDDVVITGEQRVGEQDGARQGFIGLGNIQLDYAMHPFPPLQVPPHIAAAASAAVPPKPVHVPPKPARPGFTRDTGEDVVAICPSCDQELAYDPEGDGDAIAAPARKPRSKKAQAEHHFWAVKACGHVSSYMFMVVCARIMLIHRLGLLQEMLREPSRYRKKRTECRLPSRQRWDQEAILRRRRLRLGSQSEVSLGGYLHVMVELDEVSLCLHDLFMSS
jgi:hypothetical protein